MNNSELSPTTFWLSDSELSTIYTANYWNNIEEEKKKEWWIIDNDYEKLWTYLRKSNLLSDYYSAEENFKNKVNSPSVVADLAAGIGWTSALLSKLDNVSEVHSVEISKHRIDLIFPSAIKMFQANPTKIRRYVGSFYETKFESESLDVVFLTQAFHHADRPFHLLQEVRRILKANGFVYIIGEHYVDFKKIVRRFFSSVAKEHKINSQFRKLFPPDPVLGDHYYRVSDYFFIAESLGFSCNVEKLPSGYAMFILEKQK